MKSMKYTTHDLSKILDVSTNTVRRFEEKGYLNSNRDMANGYRQFSHLDVEKLMYVSKYRKIGFSHEDITSIFREDIGQTLQRFQNKMEELDRTIEQCMAARHLLKDDIVLMQKIGEHASEIIEMDCVPMYYLLYQKKGDLKTGGEHGKALHRFMTTCSEFEYMYFFEKEDVEKGEILYSEGVVANEIFTDKYGVDVGLPVEKYEARFCFLKFMRLPMNLLEEDVISADQLQKVLFDEVLQHMKERGYVLAGDVLGVKIGLSWEEGRYWQYVLMHFPAEREP